jgi:hypothetical protein
LVSICLSRGEKRGVPGIGRSGEIGNDFTFAVVVLIGLNPEGWRRSQMQYTIMSSEDEHRP